MEKIAKMSLEQLIEIWKEIDKKKATKEIIKVRGWLLDELEKRNKEAFDKWIDDDLEDIEKFFK